MVLEALIKPNMAKPFKAFSFGIFSSSIGLLLAYWVFKEQASLVMVFLTTLAAVPFTYSMLKIEEKADIKLGSEKAILGEHYHVLVILMFLFFGMTLSMAVWYTFLPNEMASSLFSTQSQTILNINNQISGNAANNSNNFSIFTKIFLNNIRVLVFSILFSFLYGIGAIFILTWNASVIAVAIGNFIRKNLALSAEILGFQNIGNYLNVISLGLLRYAIHGIPEIAAYFVGGLAGGIISMAVINHDLFYTRKEKILSDSAELIMIAIGLLVIAGLIEVYITPLLF